MPKESDLQAIAQRLRIHSIKMTTKAGSGHPTTCLSMAEIMACLFFDEMRYNVKDPKDPANDEFVLSKGHAAPILWASYAEAGIIPFKKLDTLRQFSSPLEGHPTPNMPWVKAATGSLGQGLAIGVGMAWAQQYQKTGARTFVLLGDGECAEGSVWEAAELAANLKLRNITAIVDANRLGQSGESLHGHDVKKWKQKFVAFGWETIIVDGNNLHQVREALALARVAKVPFAIIAKTLKGKGVQAVENKEGWHGKPLPNDMLQQTLADLGPMPTLDAKKLVRAPPKARLPKQKWQKPKGPAYNQDKRVATRDAFGTMLEKLGVNENVIAVDGDVKNSTRAEAFFKAFPERAIECYIAEQNLVGVSVGLQAKGLMPFAATFGTFFTRAHDQIRMAAISRAKLNLVGSHVGVSIGEDGPSQMGLEDIALFRATPTSTVLYPCDAVSAEKLTELMPSQEGIVYLRTSRPKTPIIYKNSEKFSVGGSKVIKSSKNAKVLIIAAGVTVHEALKAAGELEKQNVPVRIIDAYSIKPLDEKTIRKEAKDRKIVVVEDHYPEGGLGEAVAALGIPIRHLAVNEVPRSGEPDTLLHVYGIDAKAIVKAVKKLK